MSSACCDPCTCTVCLCNKQPRKPGQPVLSALIEITFPGNELDLRAENDPLLPFLRKLQDQRIRKLKREILCQVNCIRTVIELERREDQIVILMCETNVDRAAVSEEIHQRLREVCVQSVVKLGYACRILNEEEFERQNQHSQSKQAPVAHVTTSDAIDETIMEVHGMKCASCVNSIETVLLNISGVHEASVALLSGTVTVHHSPDVLPSTLKQTVEDCGFDVVKLETRSKSNSNTASLSTNSHVKLLISGMTCSSCTATIENQLKEVLGIQTVSVSLLTSECAVEFSPDQIGVRDIMEHIDELGFECRLAPMDRTDSLIKRQLDAEKREIRKKLMYASIAAVPTFFISMIFDMLLPTDNPVHEFFMMELAPGLDLSSVILFVLATPIQFITAWSFHQSAYKTMRYTGTPNMDVLISIGTFAAYFASIIAMLVNLRNAEMSNMTFFETSVFLIFFILVGRYLETVAKSKTADSMANILSHRVDQAYLAHVNHMEPWNVERVEIIETELIQVGDILEVRPNHAFPCDGMIVHGETAANESMLTGESLPVQKPLHSVVLGGTINLSSLVYLKATRIGSDTALSRIVKLVEDAQSKKADIQHVADTISRWFVWTILTIALVDFIVWLIVGWTGGLSEEMIPKGFSPFMLALFFGIAVLVIACPCSLGLATPTAVMVGSGLAASAGILVKNGGEALERMAKIDSIVFDKTGTITIGKPVVTGVHSGKDIPFDEEVVWRALAIIASHSDHPLSKSITEYISGRLKDFDKFCSMLSEVPGKGVLGCVNEMKVWIGSEKWIREEHPNLIFGQNTSSVVNLLSEWRKNGESIVLCAVRDQTDDSGNVYLAAAFALSDPPRPEAHFVMQQLQNFGIDTWILSGDSPATVSHVAKQVGIASDKVFAGVLPDQKSDRIKMIQNTTQWTRYKHRLQRWSTLLFHRFVRSRYQRLGRSDCESGNDRERISDNSLVAMVGDGANDSIALAQADVGIAIGNGTDLAMSSASVLLMKSSLIDLLILVYIARRTLRKIYWNFFWAGIYNIIGVPLAAGVFYPFWHLRLQPSFAGLAMALSSVSVVVNSLSLSWGMMSKFKNIEKKFHEHAHEIS